MSAQPSRVAVIGDCPLFRRGLAQVVGAVDDLECTVGAPSVDDVGDACSRATPFCSTCSYRPPNSPRSSTG